jgi:hypothetical protein
MRTRYRPLVFAMPQNPRDADPPERPTPYYCLDCDWSGTGMVKAYDHQRAMHHVTLSGPRPKPTQDKG